MSSPIDTESRVPIREQRGKELESFRREVIKVRNHRIYKQLVVVEVHDCDPVTVDAGELERAIRNAVNAHRY